MMHLGMALDATSLRAAAAQVRRCEAGALDFVWLTGSSGVASLEPAILAAALSTVTRHIGLIASAATGQHEPYNLARRIASLDLISKGRAGWNLVASGPAARDAEYAELVRGLWNSWDADAFVYDKVAGRFFVPEKMHVLDHRGGHFTVRGPLNVGPSPQGAPVITHVLTDGTIDVAARLADIVFLDAPTFEEGLVCAVEVGRSMAVHGRPRSHVRILANVIPWIAATAALARQDRDDFAGTPMPRSGVPPQGCPVIGTPSGVADALQAAYRQGVIDGFVILPPTAHQLDSFVDAVIPELRHHGLIRVAYETPTLRGHLLQGAP